MIDKNHYQKTKVINRLVLLRLVSASACYGNVDEGAMVAGASDAFWDDRGACGSYYRVRCTGAFNDVPHPCTGGEVVVKIVDYCPPPFCNGTINLSQDAFAAIALLKAGKIYVSYSRV